MRLFFINLTSFGMVKTGDEILFVKRVQSERRLYGRSRVFAPFLSGQELCQVVF